MVLILKTVVTGITATLIMDLWSLWQKYMLSIPPLNYALVGRWLLGLPQGKIRHHTIISTPRIHGEIFAGWLFHYLTGIAFSTIPLMFHGPDWFHEPDLLTALLTGLFTVLAPFVILQPALGFGLAASSTVCPWLTRLLSLLTHLAYGLGIYVSALFIVLFSRCQ